MHDHLQVLKLINTLEETLIHLKIFGDIQQHVIEDLLFKYHKLYKEMTSYGRWTQS
jgi:hypothetical protein